MNLEWFKQPPRPPTPDPEWNKRQVVFDQPEHPWFNQMVFPTKDPLTFNDLMATPIDVSMYVLNRLKIDNLTQDLLLGPAYDLLKGTCTSSIELEYKFQEHLTIAADYFFNNDLEYLKSSDPERTYTIVKQRRTKSAQFEIVVLKDIVKKLHGYGHLEEVVVKRADQQLCNDIVDFIVALRMFTRSLIIKRQVVDLQLGVESYQKKLNITAPQQTFLEIEFKELYTPSYKTPGIIYKDLAKQKRVMRANDLYKFSDGTLKKVQDDLHHRILDYLYGYTDENIKKEVEDNIQKEIRKLNVELIV
ncbi:hypothetical protein Tco_1239829 [Tanacetum coccineum]